MRWFTPTLASLLLTNAVLAERLLLDSGRDPTFWTPVTGGEYPGATANVDVVSDEEIGPCVRATCTFARESRYAGIQWRGSIDEGEAIGFRVKPLHRGDGLLRIKDATGQWLAGMYKAKKGVWTDVRVPLEAETFTSHWGGANDGKVHLPVRALMIAGWRGPDARELRVSSLYVERTDPIPPEQTWRVEIHPGVSLGVAFPDEPAPYRVVVTNRLSTPGRVAVQAVRQAPAGREEELLEQELDIDGWAETSVTLNPSTSTPGYWRIGVRLSDTARGVRSERGSGLAVVPVPRHYGQPAPNCYFGMQIIKDLAVAERLGVKAVRQFVFWRYTEGTEGRPRWGHTDRFVAEAHRLHMDTMLTLVLKAPGWAGWELEGHPGAKSIPDPARLPEWQRFVRGATERYQDRVQVIEIENEPDLTCVRHPGFSLEQGAEYYARFLAAGAAVVRETAPHLAVAGLDVSGGDLDRGLPFTQAVLKQAGKWIDIYTGHPYASPRNFAPGQHPKWPIMNRIPEKCTAALDAMAAHGRPRRMRIGELGWALRAQMDPLSKECLEWSACIIQSMICAKSVPGVEKYLHFTQHGCNEGGHEYGLARGDPGYALPAAVAYAAAAHTLNATTPLGLTRVGDAVWRATFACPGRSELVVAWWADTANQAVELSDTTPSGTWHDSLFQRLEPDELRIPVGRLPVYTVWPLPKDGKEPEFLARIRAVSATPVHVSSVFVAGYNRLGLAVANNTGEDLTLDVRCGSEKATVALSGTPGTRNVAVPLKQGFPVGQRRNVPVVVRWQDYEYATRLGTDLSALPGPPETLRVDGEIEEWQTRPPMHVRERHDVLPPDPNVGWDGAGDLSFALWLATDRHGLHAAVAVTDDVHTAPHGEAGDFWKSDGLQIALDPENDSTDAFDEDDREIGLLLTDQGPRAYLGCPGNFRPVDLPLAIRRTGNTTVYETTLPWSLLNIPAPQSGTVMAINLIANDNDGHGRGYWMGLTPGIGEAKNPQAYREFIVNPDKNNPR